MENRPSETDKRRRQRALGILAKAKEQELEACVEAFDKLPSYRWLRPPERGAVMVRGRVGGDGAAFNLGEMTTTRCALELEDGTVGYGYVKGHHPRHSELVALFDALLQGENWRGPLYQNALETLATHQAERKSQAKQKANATRVNFFTLVRGEND